MKRSPYLEATPFSSAPDPARYQAIGSVALCQQQLETTLREDVGIGLLIGPPGTGKSLLCQVLAGSLRDDFDVVLLAEAAPRDPSSLLQHILFHLNLPYRGLSEGELRLSLIDRLTQAAQSQQRRLVLIVDEAQSLPDTILEELRMISNIVRSGHACVRTVLAGSSLLEERLAEPHLEALAQRVAVRCYLHPLSAEEVTRYLRNALGEPAAITDDAAAAIHFACGGIPRLVHQIMLQILRDDPDQKITIDRVNDAWTRSQQLASPVIEPEVRNPAEFQPEQADPEADKLQIDDIVEFGPLGSSTRCDALDEADSTSPEEDEALPEKPETDALPDTETLPEIPQPAAATEPHEEAAQPGHAEDLREPESPPVANTLPEVAAELDRMTDALRQLALTTTEFASESVEVDAEPDEQTPAAAQAELESFCNQQWVIPSVDPVELETVEWQDEANAGTTEELCTSALDDHGPAAHALQQDPDAAPGEATETPPEVQANQEASLVTPADLFGDDFDEEVPVPTGGIGSGEASDWSLVHKSDQPELRLHDEVVELSAEAATLRLHATDLDRDDLGFHAAETETPRAIGSDGFVPDQDAPLDDIQLSDDSDMLIVEESVEVEPPAIAPQPFDDDPTDSDDYQALLQRMRKGQN